MKILVLSPHTDDAELGCGGSIARFIEEGHEIYWIVFSTAENSVPSGLPRDTLKKEFLGVVDDLNLNEQSYEIFTFNVRYLYEYRQDILEELVKVRNRYRPEIIIGPSLNDFHQDHQVVANEMVRAFKTTSSIICYELPWNHITFNTQLFSSLSEHQMSKKIKLLENYKSQNINERFYFSDDFLYGLARTRGVQCNSKYAEAFEVIRWRL